MKRAICILLCMLLLLSACGKKKETSTSGTSDTNITNNTTLIDGTNTQNSTTNINTSSQTANKTTTAKAATEAITQNNLIPLCFDLIDFMRTQALGKTFATPAAERDRVKNLISGSWSKLDEQTKNTLTEMAKTAGQIKSEYNGMSQSKKSELKAEWKKLVLSPALLYPPLAEPKTYSAGGISFCFPSNWSSEPFSYNSTDFLFTYKNGIPLTTYQDVYDMTKSPPGSLATLQNTNGYSAAAIANELANTVTANAPKMKKINSYDTSLGSIRIMNGYFPDQSAEKFMWLVVIPKGNQYIFCRMTGNVSEADTYVAAFYNMLNTLNWSTTPAGSSGTYSGAFETAWSRVSSAIVKDIWS